MCVMGRQHDKDEAPQSWKDVLLTQSLQAAAPRRKDCPSSTCALLWETLLNTCVPEYHLSYSILLPHY